jgi:hypothetical protein
MFLKSYRQMKSMFSNTASSIVSSSTSVLAVCLLGLAVGTGCSASADIPEVTVTRSDVEFLGVPLVPGYTDVDQTVTSTFDHPSDFELPSELNPELHPLGASIEGRDNMQDLSFLDRMTVILGSRAPNAPEPIVLASYERAGNGEVGRVVRLETASNSDVLSFWDTKEAYYDITLWGTLPEQDWSVDVTFSFSGHLSVSSSD